MFQAQILMNSESTAVYSPWQERGGDNVIWPIEVVNEALAGTDARFEVQVFHKNSDDTGDGVAVGSSIAFEDPGILHLDVTAGLKEMVRLKFSFNENATADSWVLFRALSAVFYDAVDA